MTSPHVITFAAVDDATVARLVAVTALMVDIALLLAALMVDIVLLLTGLMLDIALLVTALMVARELIVATELGSVRHTLSRHFFGSSLLYFSYQYMC